jgi:cytochrome c556
MRVRKRALTLTALILAASLGLLVTLNPSRADEDDDTPEARAKVKEAAKAINELAAAVEEKDPKLEALAGTVAGKFEELKPIMTLFKLRKKDGGGGLGFGATPGANTPDGIEAKLENMSKRPMPASDLAKQADDISRMAAITGAIAEVTLIKPQGKNAAEKFDWQQYTKDMRTWSAKMAAAAQAKNPKDLKTAAANLNSTCTDCHKKFRP